MPDSGQFITMTEAVFYMFEFLLAVARHQHIVLLVKCSHYQTDSLLDLRSCEPINNTSLAFGQCVIALNVFKAIVRIFSGIFLCM